MPPTLRVRRLLIAIAASSLVCFAQINVLTDNYTNDRSNANLQETILTPANVSTGSFGKLGSFPVDGQVYAQPLYVSGVSIPGKGTHNVVYITTEHNSVFAYDADAIATPNLLWQVNLGPSVPNTFFDSFADVAPEIGILSTGVIDPQAGALYVVTESIQALKPVFQLHALDIRTGSEMLNGPVTVAGQVPGTGAASSGGVLKFDAMWHLQRPGLLLANGGVYFTFGSHGDDGQWHGWLFRYSASDLHQSPTIFNATPNGNGGAIWQSGRGLAADDAGNIYAISGNGDYDGVTNFSESFLKLSAAAQPALLDWFTPPNWSDLANNDADLSAGAGLVPGTHNVVGGDKYGNLYLVNGDSMGSGTTGNAQVFRAVQNGGIFNFALWNRGSVTYLFMPELFASFKCFAIVGGVFGTAPVSLASGPAIDNEYTGLSISANALQDGTGILWATTGNHSNVNLPGTLHAYDATNLGNELWNSDMNPNDFLGTFAKFANPTVVNGKVYVPTWSNSVSVYGLLPGSTGSQTPALAAVLNAASYAQKGVSPGEIVTIFGQNMGRSQTDSLQLDDQGNVTRILGNTLVLFDGFAAPMLYAAPGQVSAVVPFGLASDTTQVQLEYNGQMSNVLAVPVAAATPGIFTADSSGAGPAAALNQDYSLNSVNNPATAGSVLMLYATGAGQMSPQPPDGSVVTADNLPQPLQNVSVQVGGQPATILYAGGAPGEVSGVLQINIQLPAGVTGANVPVMLTIGNANSRPGVTLAIQ
jgi:uncharacterized protein (TIGR03437 family)